VFAQRVARVAIVRWGASEHEPRDELSQRIAHVAFMPEQLSDPLLGLICRIGGHELGPLSDTKTVH
jgi:hypothetical protein